MTTDDKLKELEADLSAAVMMLEQAIVEHEKSLRCLEERKARLKIACWNAIHQDKEPTK